MLGWTTRRGRRKSWLFAFAAVLLAMVGCQIVAGIETRKLDPINAGCALPSTGDGPQVRVANMVPTGDLVDVCIRSAGAASWGRPILLNGGTDCADASELGAVGFAYADVSIPFTAPSATVDVKFIAGGSTCSASAISEGDGLTLATNAVTTLVSMGGNGVSTQVVALPESDSPAQSGFAFRLVHAAPGTGSLDLGITQGSAPPTTVTAPILSGPIPFGGTVPAGTTSSFASATLGDNGYLEIFAGTFNFGASLDGAGNKALFAYKFPNGTAAYSMYVIGIQGDNQHPLRALVCSEDAGQGKTPFTIACTPSQLSSISVDIFNSALYGPNSPDFKTRETLVPTAIAGRDSDIMCLVEVDEDADKTRIVQTVTSTGGGTGPYGYVYMPTTNLSTPFTNPADQNGQVPPAPTTPPCDGVDQSLIDAVISCGEQNCSTQPPGDSSGKLNSSTDCLVANCPAPFLNLQGAQGPSGAPVGVACYDCLVVYIASDTNWQTTQDNCTTDTHAPLGFSGNENSMIISRYPLNNTDVLVLPSTFYRRTVLYAQVELEDQTVDFYCGFLSTTLNASALPYVGSYGNGATDSQTAWQNEQALQAQQLVNWVQKKSGSNPAIITGDWRSSIGVSADAGVVGPPGTFLPNDLSPATMNLLLGTSGWAPVVDTTSGTTWGPQCNFCPQAENPYNLTDSYFVAQPIVANWPDHATTSESLIYTQGAVTVDAGVQAPVSPYYGVNFRVIRPK